VHEDLLKLPSINDLKPCNQTIIFFDDIVTDISKHPIISEYFIRGLNKSASIMFLSQSFYNTQKIIRQNINYCIIFKLGGSRDVNAILRLSKIKVFWDSKPHTNEDKVIREIIRTCYGFCGMPVTKSKRIYKDYNPFNKLKRCLENWKDALKDTKKKTRTMAKLFMSTTIQTRFSF
jgi:hypothetical protein